MKHRIIAISRQFGSGGRTVGKLVAQELGIPCYDQELIEKISEVRYSKIINNLNFEEKTEEKVKVFT